MEFLKEKILHPRTGVFILLVFIAGCSMWGNFTTYFNRYYNAEKAFEEAMDEIQLSQNRELFAFKEDKIPAKANKNFETVIKNCSKILQFNKDSKYVNESIFMLGKAFYYKGQYNKALRKFQELDGLNDEDLMLLNRLWIAKSEMQMRNFTAGLQHLQQVKEIAKAQEEEDIVFEAYRTEISYLIYKENYSKAVQIINELLQQPLPDETLAEVQYELGLLYVTLNDYEKAVDAFQHVIDEGSATFDIEFKSELEYAKAIKHLGRIDEALDLLQEMRDDTKYTEYWDTIDLEIAQIHLDKDEPKLALELFTTIDTAYKKTPSAGIAAFMRADIVEHYYEDFDSAKILYDRINSKLAPDEFKIEARKKSGILKRRKDYTDKILTSKREEVYLIDTLKFKQDSLAYVTYLARRDSAEQVYKRIHNIQEPNKNTRNARTSNKRSRTRSNTRNTQNKFKFVYEEDSLFTYKPKMPKITLDSMRTFIAKNEYELGNLYFTDLNVLDSAYYYYTDILENYPNTDYQARTMYALGSYYLTIDENEKADSLFREVYDNYKEDPVAKAAAVRLGIDAETLGSDPAKEKYVQGEEKLDNKEYFDAIDDFFSIYKEYPKSQYAPKALYTIGWIYENKLFDNGFAADYYDTLQTHYPRTEYARSVYSKLKFYKRRMKAIQDSIAQVQKAIEDSLRLIAQKDSLARLDSLSLQDSLSTTQIDSAATTGAVIADSSTVKMDSTAIKPQVQDSTKKNRSEQK